VIVLDVNLLVYAYNADAPLHAPARDWVQNTLNGRQAVGLPWAVLCGFIRITTSPRILVEPMLPLEALTHVHEWLRCPGVDVLDPGRRHLEIVGRLLEEAGVAGSLTTDIHLAAIAMEYQCTLASNDQDFGRFSGLRWVNPLA
jgi:uncharacterized protein